MGSHSEPFGRAGNLIWELLASVYILSEFSSDGKIRDTNSSRCFFF